MSVIQNTMGTSDVEKPTRKSNLKPGLTDFMAGEKEDFVANLAPHLPADLIGGSVPYVRGSEDESVWNAAAQACGTERVHYSYTIEGDRLWYLACPSASMASNPDSWCPLAAALPGGSEHWDKETVYLYEQEGVASALRWDAETSRMQVFLGASRTILPRVQSMDANFVTINPEVADIKRWRNRTLYTEKLSRGVARMLIISGLIVNLIAAIILIGSLFSIGYVQRDLTDVKERTDQAALELMNSAAGVMQSDTIRHMVRIQELLDNLSLSNGYLVKYNVEKKATQWDAIVTTALGDQAVRDTTYKQVISGRAPVIRAPKAEKEDNEHVRLKGTK